MKKFTILLSIFLALISIDTKAQILFKSEIFGNFGYEQNIFRAPDLLELSDGTSLNESNLILSDSYADLGYDLYAKYKLKRKHVLRIYHDIWNRRYLNNPSLNQFKMNFKFNYDYKITKKMHVGLIYRFDRVNKIGTSVLGDDLTQQFSYNKNLGEIHFVYKPFKYTGINLTALYYKKMYDKMLNVAPLDFNNLGVALGFNQKFALKTILFKAKLDIDYSQKIFSDIIASSTDGSELIDNPLRIWNYYSGKFSVSGLFMNGFEFTPFIKYRIRKDTFEDYYSYNALSYGIDLGFEGDKLAIVFSPDMQVLDYKVKTAPDPALAIDPLLTYKYLNLSFEASYQVFKWMWVTFEYRNKTREANTLDFARKTRRSYSYYEIMGGIKINPVAIFKK